MVGKAFNGLQDMVSSGCLELKPANDQEATVHNIYHDSDAVLEFVNSTFHNESITVIEEHIGPGSWMGLVLHCTSTLFYRVRNPSTTDPATFGYDGVITYEGPDYVGI